MRPSSRLTLLAAASAAMLAAAVPAFAQADAAGSRTDPPAQPAQEQQAPRGQSERPATSAPTGCPFRDGKLDLIV